MLDRALERRTLVQATLMRGTIHIVSAADFWLFAEGIRRAGREWWHRVYKPHAQQVDVAAASAALRELLRGSVRSRAEVVAAMRELDPPGARPGTTWAGVDVFQVRVPPSGTWTQRRAHAFGLAEEWVKRPDVTEEEGLEHLARRYLGAFGPATLNDLAGWSGVPVTFFRDVVDRMSLRRFRDEEGRVLLDLPRAPLPDPEAPAPVRFLPTWDAVLLTHARRTGLLPERYRPRIFTTKQPQSVGTFLVDGSVAGTWRYEGGRVRATPFARLSRAARADVADEAERLGGFLGDG